MANKINETSNSALGKVGLYLFVLVAIPFLWLVFRPYLDPVIYNMHIVKEGTEVNTIVNKFYANRGVGYVNNEFIFPALRNESNVCILDVLRNDTRIVKTSYSDSIIVKNNSEVNIFIIDDLEEY